MTFKGQPFKLLFQKHHWRFGKSNRHNCDWLSDRTPQSGPLCTPTMPLYISFQGPSMIGGVCWTTVYLIQGAWQQEWPLIQGYIRCLAVANRFKINTVAHYWFSASYLTKRVVLKDRKFLLFLLSTIRSFFILCSLSLWFGFGRRAAQIHYWTAQAQTATKGKWHHTAINHARKAINSDTSETCDDVEIASMLWYDHESKPQFKIMEDIRLGSKGR